MNNGGPCVVVGSSAKMNNGVCDDQSVCFSLKNRRCMEKFGEAVWNLAISDPLRPFTPERRAQISQILADFSPILTSIPSHMTYAAMIHRAITDLNKKEGSSEGDISRFILSTYSSLPWAHSPLLKLHLKNLCQSGEIVLSSNGCYSFVVVDSVYSPRKGSKNKRKRMPKQVNCLGLGEKPGRSRQRRKENPQKSDGFLQCEKGGGTEEKHNVGSQIRALTCYQEAMVEDSDLEEDRLQVGAGKNQRHMVFDRGFHNENVYMEDDHRDKHPLSVVRDYNKRFGGEKLMQHKKNVVEDELDRGMETVEENRSGFPVLANVTGKHEEFHIEEIARKLFDFGELNGRTESSVHLIQFPETQKLKMVNENIITLQPTTHVEGVRAQTETGETNGKTTSSNMITKYPSDEHHIEKSQKLYMDIGTQRSWNEENLTVIPYEETRVQIMPNAVDIDCGPLGEQIIDIEEGNVFEDELVPNVDIPVINHQILPQANGFTSKMLDMGILSAKTFSEAIDIHGNRLRTEDVGVHEHDEHHINTFKGIVANKNFHRNHNLYLASKNFDITDRRTTSNNIDNMEDDEIKYLGNECRGIVFDHCSQYEPVMQTTEKNLDMIKSNGSSFTGQDGSQHFMFTRVLRSGACRFITSQNIEHNEDTISHPVKEELPNMNAQIEGLLQSQPQVRRGRGRPRKHPQNLPSLNLTNTQKPQSLDLTNPQKPQSLDLANTQKPPGPDMQQKRRGRGRPCKVKLN